MSHLLHDSRLQQWEYFKHVNLYMVTSPQCVNPKQNQGATGTTQMPQANVIPAVLRQPFPSDSNREKETTAVIGNVTCITADMKPYSVYKLYKHV